LLFVYEHVGGYASHIDVTVTPSRKVENSDSDGDQQQSSLPVEIVDNNDGTYCAKFTPVEGGEYNIETKVWGHGIVDDMGPVRFYGAC